MPDPKKPALLIPVRADTGDLADAEKPLPAVLQAASRGAGGGPDPLLANVVVEESYTLAAVGRGEAPDTRRIEDGPKLLALEAADGTAIFMRSDRLQEEFYWFPSSGLGTRSVKLQLPGIHPHVGPWKRINRQPIWSPSTPA